MPLKRFCQARVTSRSSKIHLASSLAGRSRKFIADFVARLLSARQQNGRLCRLLCHHTLSRPRLRGRKRETALPSQRTADEHRTSRSLHVHQIVLVIPCQSGLSAASKCQLADSSSPALRNTGFSATIKPSWFDDSSAARILDRPASFSLAGPLGGPPCWSLSSRSRKSSWGRFCPT